jgi:hypothetical protein
MPLGILVVTESMPLEAFRKQAHSKHAKTEKKENVREKNCKIFFTVLKSHLGIDKICHRCVCSIRQYGERGGFGLAPIL